MENMKDVRRSGGSYFKGTMSAPPSPRNPSHS